MGAALSIFILLSLSVFVIRIASVALRLTGLEESSAKFRHYQPSLGPDSQRENRKPSSTTPSGVESSA